MIYFIFDTFVFFERIDIPFARLTDCGYQAKSNAMQVVSRAKEVSLDEFSQKINPASNAKNRKRRRKKSQKTPFQCHCNHP
jgi:hypothetical protein